MLHAAEHLAAHLVDEAGCVLLELLTESVIGGDEVPGLSAFLDHRRCRHLRQRVGIIGEMHGVRAAQLVGQRARTGAGEQRNLVALAHHVVDGDRDAGIGDIDDGVDLAVVEPAAHDLHADVGLHLVVGADDLDRLAEHGGAEFLDRHLGGLDRTGAAVIAPPARQIRQHADPHRVVGDLRGGHGRHRC